MPAEPAQLPLGIAPGRLLDEGNRLVARHLAAQRPGGLAVADGLHAGAVGGNPAFQQPGRLLKKPFPAHAVHPLLDPFIQLSAVLKAENRVERLKGGRPGPALVVVGGLGPARQAVDLLVAVDDGIFQILRF